MAIQNGIITGAMKSSLDSAIVKFNDYPDMANSAASLLAGNGNWIGRTLNYETITGGYQINWSDGVQAVTIPTDISHTETFTGTFDSDTGLFSFNRGNGSTALQFNAYDMLSHVNMSTNAETGALEYKFPNGTQLFNVPVASGDD